MYRQTSKIVVASARLAAGIVQFAARNNDSGQAKNDAHAAQPLCRFRLTQQAGERLTRAQSGPLVQIRGFQSHPKAKLNQQVIQGLWPDRSHESDSRGRRAPVPVELGSRNSSARDTAALAGRQEPYLRRDLRCGHSSLTMNQRRVCRCGTDSCHRMRMPLTTTLTLRRSSQSPSKHAAARAKDVRRLALLWHNLRH